MKIHGTIEAIYSKRDVNGNCYWAMRYTDNNTGHVVEATTVGGESNIHGIRYGFSVANEHDAGIRTSSTQLGIREFNRLTKEWAHAGCCSDKLREYIKDRIGVGVLTVVQPKQRDSRLDDPSYLDPHGGHHVYGHRDSMN